MLKWLQWWSCVELHRLSPLAPVQFPESLNLKVKSKIIYRIALTLIIISADTKRFKIISNYVNYISYKYYEWSFYRPQVGDIPAMFKIFFLYQMQPLMLLSNTRFIYLIYLIHFIRNFECYILSENIAALMSKITLLA